jgi:colicin import membrane protein
VSAAAVLDPAPFRPRRPQPALVRSAILATLVHLVLFGVMFLGVRMQNRPADTVTVELWEPPPPPPPQPVVEAPKPPPVAEPEPEVRKPDIAIREKPKPKPEPKLKPPPKRDLEFEKRMREQALNESRKLDEQRKLAEENRKERELRDLIARQQADAQAKALATWVDRIRGKIRGNIIFDTAQVPGNPAAVFDVTLLPTGEVLTVRRRRSSGHPGYDEAVERAILKSSPLPKPEPVSLFQRQLELTFRPQDK